MRKLITSHAPSAPDPVYRDRLERFSLRVQFELKCSTMKTTMFLFLIIVSMCTSMSNGAQTELDQDDLRTIKNQLTLLMEKRQQDYQQLEKSLHESLKGNTDLDALKEEIQLLR